MVPFRGGGEMSLVLDRFKFGMPIPPSWLSGALKNAVEYES